MKNLFESLNNCRLFDGISTNELESLLSCLDVKTAQYRKNSIILAEGDPAEYICIVLSGTAQIVRIDYYGNRSILAGIFPPNIFGEAFACADAESLPVNVVAAEDSEIMLIKASRIIKSCPKACGFHNRLVSNLLKVVARKNLLIQRKNEITSKRTTREKLVTYLLMQAKDCGKNTFSIPFDRQELADYLEVDRSGLSAEISKMRKEGIIQCKKSIFTLLETK